MFKTLKILIILFLIPLYGNAQFTELTSNGFKLGDNNKGIIIEIQNKTASELYNGTLDFINKNYINPTQLIIAKTENRYIRFTTLEKNIAKVKTVLGSTSIFGQTTYEIDFKDNKIRIYSINPIWKRDDIHEDYPLKGDLITASVYNLKGNIKPEALKNNVISSINSYYNSFLNAYINHLKEINNDW